MKATWGLVALALAGCQNRSEGLSAEDRLGTYLKRPLSEFILATGFTPSSGDTVAPGQRLFTIQGGASVTLVTPGSYGAPTVARTQACVYSILTTYKAGASTPADYIVSEITARGPCG